MNRLKNHFYYTVQNDLLFKDHFVNIMQVPKLTKVILNSGIGHKAVIDRKQIFSVLLGLELISSQKPKITRARQSVDKFKLRKNMPIGCKLTLRKRNMYLFLDNLITTVFPNFEDLKDISQKRQHKLNFDIEMNTKKSNVFLPKNTKNSLQNVSSSLGFKQKKIGYWSTAFGINDFFLFPQIPYEKLNTLTGYGFNVIFVVDKLYDKNLSKPKYFLSSLQIPL